MFNGSRFRAEIVPKISNFIATNQRRRGLLARSFGRKLLKLRHAFLDACAIVASPNRGSNRSAQGAYESCLGG